MSATSSTPGLGGMTRIGWGSRRGADLFAVEPDKLTLRCLRTYTLAPDQVVAIERLSNGWFDGGVRIVHNRADCPRRMSFWCHGGSDEVLRRLAAAGFVPRGSGATGQSMWSGAARGLFALMILYTIVTVLFRVLR